MRKRVMAIKHSQIFDYWKDKAITRDGKIVKYDDVSVENIPVVFDWGEPECWACGLSINKIFDYKTYDEYLKTDFKKIWDYKEVSSKLNRCHIIPHSIGGSCMPQNMFLLCEQCHAESPDTNNPENFFRWVYRRRKDGKSVKGFNISQIIEDFLYWCNEKGKNPYTAKLDEIKPLQHGGGYSQSSIVMTLVDTCDDLR